MVKRQARTNSNQEPKTVKKQKLQNSKRSKQIKSEKSTPLPNFNEHAKLAAIKSKKADTMRRTQSKNSKTETSHRSFLIFNTPEPQPASIKVFNIEADSQDEQPYQIITSNNAEVFMETFPVSLSTRTRPLTAATSTLEDST